ncbi:CRTAC1 family protein [Agaribacterium sp. ZY112]|uniref:CRTAC1 family protein n=1 Tax=Agaribacterium sp. ZY112 TaxID=3233574 RepID=UPI0035231DAF
MKAPCYVLGALLFSGLSACNVKNDSPDLIQFKEVSEERGLITKDTWKYGGPAIADLNYDGRYELMLSNHHEEPTQLFWADGANNFVEHKEPIMRWDMHGVSPGDYDLDGDLDIMVTLGGGNGSQPQPPRLLRNDNGEFTNVTEGSGFDHMGARGRSVRWVDLDGDGDLDFFSINAIVVNGNEGPRNILFENLGNDKFAYRASSAFEQFEAERVLLTDFNGDRITDVVAFEPLSLWQGTHKFEFINVSDSWLPLNKEQREHGMAVANIDYDNDGDLDLYIARGKTYYKMANNGAFYYPDEQRIDIRDFGSLSHDGVSFSAEGDISLSDFFLWPRKVRGDLPLFLGEKQIEAAMPRSAEPESFSQEQAKGFNSDLKEQGWYLGYLGNGNWRLEWKLDDAAAWDIRMSIHGINDVALDWTAQDMGVGDILLRNEGNRFSDLSALLPKESGDNNWGVTHGDFNNDGFEDLFVYRFGEFHKRINDLMLLNRAGAGFELITKHNATVLEQTGHGDMGAAFDYDLDGDVDILSGDDDQGRWHLFENQSQIKNDSYLLIELGYSEKGNDVIGALVEIETQAGKQIRRVGSAGATHSQSVLNTVHFGLGAESTVKTITVTWADDSQKELRNIKAKQRIFVGKRL